MFFVGVLYPLIAELSLIALSRKRSNNWFYASVFVGWLGGMAMLPNF